jgi:hypothetical protein
MKHVVFLSILLILGHISSYIWDFEPWRHFTEFLGLVAIIAMIAYWINNKTEPKK